MRKLVFFSPLALVLILLFQNCSGGFREAGGGTDLESNASDDSQNDSSNEPDVEGACYLNTDVIASGESIDAFQSPTVPFGSSCVKQVRTCTDGTLSGSFSFPACEVLAQNGMPSPAPTPTPQAPGFSNQPLPPLVNQFQVQFDAAVGASNADVVMGLSKGSVSQFTHFAMGVRFNQSGRLDVRNGANYGFDRSITYQNGAIFRIRLVANLSTRKYSVYVTRSGIAAEETLATDYAFRADVPAFTEIDNFATGVTLGSVVISNLSSSSMSSPPSPSPSPAPTPTPLPPLVDGSCTNPNALGVARTLVINNRGGAKFGAFNRWPALPLNDMEVVLTFDDGPHRTTTPFILDALKAECTKATFLMIGRKILAEPAIARRAGQEGHNAGTHSQTHPNLATLSLAAGIEEIRQGLLSSLNTLAPLPAQQRTTPFFRFPMHGSSDGLLEYLGTRNMVALSADITSEDWKSTLTPDQAMANITTRLTRQKKGILLFHDNQQKTREFMPRLLRWFKDNGYKIVHLTTSDPLIAP